MRKRGGTGAPKNTTRKIIARIPIAPTTTILTIITLTTTILTTITLTNTDPTTRERETASLHQSQETE